MKEVLMGSVQALSTLISWSNDPSASWSCLDEVMEALMLCGSWAGDRINVTLKSVHDE